MRLERIAADVIQAPKLEPRIMRYELSDYEWTAIKPAEKWSHSRSADLERTRSYTRSANVSAFRCDNFCLKYRLDRASAAATFGCTA
jgi:hypothetical protein